MDKLAGLPVIAGNTKGAGAPKIRCPDNREDAGAFLRLLLCLSDALYGTLLSRVFSTGSSGAAVIEVENDFSADGVKGNLSAEIAASVVAAFGHWSGALCIFAARLELSRRCADGIDKRLR